MILYSELEPVVEEDCTSNSDKRPNSFGKYPVWPVVSISHWSGKSSDIHGDGDRWKWSTIALVSGYIEEEEGKRDEYGKEREDEVDSSGGWRRPSLLWLRKVQFKREKLNVEDEDEDASSDKGKKGGVESSKAGSHLDVDQVGRVGADVKLWGSLEHPTEDGVGKEVEQDDEDEVEDDHPIHLLP